MTDKKPLILCVDDDPDLLSFLQIVLEAGGFAYVGAESAEAGLRTYRETGADAVIVDLMMEEVDSGAALVKDLLALGCRVPIFMLSSVGDSLNLGNAATPLGLAGVFETALARAQLITVLRGDFAEGPPE